MCTEEGTTAMGFSMLQLKAGKDCHNAAHHSACTPHFYPEASSVLSELNGSRCSLSLPNDSFVAVARRDVTGMWQELHLDLLGPKNSHDVKSWKQRKRLGIKGGARDLSEDEL